MASYREVKGLSVVALAEGKKIGQIEDLIVDPQAGAVRWLRVSAGGGNLFSGGPAYWVRTAAVHSIGEHAVTIRSEADMLRAEDEPDAAEFAKGGRTLLGKKVLTEGGTFLGEARDFVFDPANFKLTDIRVEQGGGLSPRTTNVPAEHLLTIGQDMVIVADRAVSDVRPDQDVSPSSGDRREVGRMSPGEYDSSATPTWRAAGASRDERSEADEDVTHDAPDERATTRRTGPDVPPPATPRP